MTSRGKTGLVAAGAAAVAAVAAIALSGGATGPAGATVPPDSTVPGETVTGDAATRSITVTGHGSVTVVPDIAYLDAGVQASAPTAEEALDTVGTSSQDLVTTLTALGIAEEDIQTSGLSLFPTFDDEGRTITGYQASTNVRVTIRDVESVGAVVDGLKGFVGEELTLGGISFGYDDPEEVLGDARSAAVDNARTRAAQYAEAAGADVGEILRIVEGSVPEVPVFAAGVAADEAARSQVAIEPGTAGPLRRRHRRVRHGVSPAAWRRPGHGVRSVAMAPPSPKRAATSISALARAALRPERPDRLPRAAIAMAAWGPTMAGAVAGATARYPLAPAVIDDEGRLSFADLWAASDGVARGLRARGVGPASTVGVLGRNHRGFVTAVVAASKLGADIVYLNTGFAGPQLADVVAHEGIDAVLHDDELAAIAEGCGASTVVGGAELRALAVERSYLPLLPTRRAGRQVILTSGTTGRPKGAARSTSGGLDALTPLLESIPIRARDTVVIVAPLFHAWGLSHLGVGLALSSTAVVQARFDPEATLAAVAAHDAAGLVVVPVMLQRILALDSDVLDRHDTSSLRYIASSGSAIGAPLVRATLDRFGPILYNVYGSTEVSLGTVAGPADLRAAPSTAGRPAPATVVRILDDDGREVAIGESGRVFVGSASRFEGYTGGGGKEEVGGLLSSGDIGHFDGHGRLFIDGREDDMIVSGGENVFPGEVEDLLAAHPAVAEVAVIGVSDPEFGQRLQAHVVKRPGARLTGRQVQDHVRAHLARYKVPASVVFLDALPRTTTGKILRRELG